MSTTSYVLHSRRTLIAQEILDRYVTIEQGKITQIASLRPSNCTIEELGDLVLMPGLIDSHVHINEPGRTEWEGFETATRAAAAGGITTLVDMPLNSSPVTTNIEALQAKLAAAEGKMQVNCAFYGGIVPGNHQDLIPMLEAGVIGIKAFLSHSGIDEFPNVEEADLAAGMAVIAKYKVPLLAHAELVSDHPEINCMDETPSAHDAWLRSRPKYWENDAVELLIKLCRKTGCKTHVVHLSSAEAMPMLSLAQKEGLPITVETCPHYLIFAAEDIAEGKTLFKCAPPIRERANNELLWDGLRSGLISMVVTDHSPATPALKGMESGRFREAWGGIASLQFSLAATWTGAQARGFRLNDVSNWMSQNVATFLGLEGCKGKIAVGFDADLCIWDPEAICETNIKNIHHRHPVSPFTDMHLKGKVKRTIVAGKTVFEDGKFPNFGSGKIILKEV